MSTDFLFLVNLLVCSSIPIYALADYFDTNILNGGELANENRPPIIKFVQQEKYSIYSVVFLIFYYYLCHACRRLLTFN